MDSTHAAGMLLVAISAGMLALHWFHWSDTEKFADRSERWQSYARHLVRRRTVASSLVGVVGVTLMAFETVPQTPLSITAYLLALVLMTCWILWLACRDMYASRKYHHEQNLDQIAQQLREAGIDRDSREL